MVRANSYPDDLRDRLVMEALDRLRTGAPEDVSLRDLAAACGTSTNAIYSIFGGKDALVDAVAHLAREDFLGPQFELVTREPSLEVLEESGTLYRTWAHHNPGLYRLIFGLSDAEGTFAPRAQMMAPIQQLLERMQAGGILLPHDSKEMALSLWASTHGFVMLEMCVWPAGMDTNALYRTHLANSVGRVIAHADAVH